LLSRKELPHPHSWWEELDRLYDALPAGLFTLEAYERFLEDFFVRRSVPNSFLSIPTTLRILAHDLDSGEPVAFGSPSFDHVTVTRACIASMAVPPFFSPVRIGDRHYIDPGAAQLRHLDIAAEQGAEVVLFINPMVPIRATRVPTGHGLSASLRDKGMLWVVNQAIRIGVSAAAHAAERRVRDERAFAVIVIEPEPEDTVMFLNNPSSFAARRTILEQSYKSTRALLSRYFEVGHPGVRRAGWRPAESGPASMRPSAAPKP
jgi:predicted acylesterase/phospholipase RssA